MTAALARVQGLPVYAGWEAVPAELGTRTALRREGLRPGPDSEPVAQAETWFKRRRNLYDLFRRDACRPVPRRPGALEGSARAKVTRLTCGRCARVMARPADIIFRGSYVGFGASIPEPRVCDDCYRAHWRICEGERCELVCAQWRPGLARMATFDFETTGLNDAAITEVAIVAWDEVLFESLVDPGPGPRWEERAIEITGITPETVRGAPAWPEVEARIAEVLVDYGIAQLGSWSSFEPETIGCENRRRGLPGTWPASWSGAGWFDVRADVYDVLHDRWSEYGPPERREDVERRVRESSRRRDRDWNRFRDPPLVGLSTASRQYGVRPGCHRAAADSLATWGVLERMLCPAAPASRCAGCGATSTGGKRTLFHRCDCPVDAVEQTSVRRGEPAYESAKVFREADLAADPPAAPQDDDLPF